MSLFVETKYINQISLQLRNFKKKDNKSWNFSCPICGDSQKKKFKARGYLYEVNGRLNYKCHNCAVSISFSNFLKEINSSLHQNYLAEKYINGNGRTLEKPKFQIPEGKKPKVTEKVNLIDISFLSNTNIAKKYALQRKIPKEYHSDLYYCENFKDWANSLIPGIVGENVKEHSRLVIPFRDKERNVFAYQGRALDKNNNPKYFTIKLNEDMPLIYGLDRCNFDEQYYVVEGPIDCMFLSNAIAVSGLNLPTILDKSNAVIVFDNEPRNVHLVKSIEKAINSHFKICLLPRTQNRTKDINEFILSGVGSTDLESLLSKNISRDLTAKLMLSKWRKQ
jgi:hypothetical protein|tara:strand:- start:669 stop:1676 length:1008 start_codon:yes stop_codon:yes gene_type:complete